MSSDFAGDFVLSPDQTNQQPEPDPHASQPQPERPWRLPDFNVLKIENHARHPAVDRCLEAARRALEEGYNSGQKKSFCIEMAKAAYIGSMPSPVAEWDTRSFIACVTYGMLASLIEPELASRLLYAAQIALTGTTQKRKF